MKSALCNEAMQATPPSNDDGDALKSALAFLAMHYACKSSHLSVLLLD